MRLAECAYGIQHDSAPVGVPPNQRYKCHLGIPRMVFAMIPRMAFVGFRSSTRPTIYYDNLSIRNSITTQ